MSVPTKTLRFISNGDLGENVTLMFMFKPPQVVELYKDEFPISWSVFQLPAFARAQAVVIFRENAAEFFVPQIDEHGNVYASVRQPCPIGYSTSLVDESGSLLFTQSVPGREGFLECDNKTSSAASFGLGSLNGLDLLSPTVIWKNIPVTSILSVRPIPELLIYATSQYEPSEIITGPIQAPLLWDQNLDFLTDVSTFLVSVDPLTREISITQIFNQALEETFV